MPGTQDKLSQF